MAGRQEYEGGWFLRQLSKDPAPRGSDSLQNRRLARLCSGQGGAGAGTVGVQRSGGARQGRAVPWCCVFMPCLSVGTTLGNAMLGVTGEGHYPECHLGRQTFM